MSFAVFLNYSGNASKKSSLPFLNKDVQESWERFISVKIVKYWNKWNEPSKSRSDWSGKIYEIANVESWSWFSIPILILILDLACCIHFASCIFLISFCLIFDSNPGSWILILDLAFKLILLCPICKLFLPSGGNCIFWIFGLPDPWFRSWILDPGSWSFEFIRLYHIYKLFSRLEVIAFSKFLFCPILDPDPGSWIMDLGSWSFKLILLYPICNLICHTKQQKKRRNKKRLSFRIEHFGTIQKSCCATSSNICKYKSLQSCFQCQKIVNCSIFGKYLL